MGKTILTVVTGVLLGFGGLVQAQNPPAPEQSAAAQTASQTWQGTLVDAGCKSATPAADCEISATTSSFGLMTSDGRFLKFDSEGNEMVKTEIEKANKSGKVSVEVSGALEGEDSIKVESLSFR